MARPPLKVKLAHPLAANQLPDLYKQLLNHHGHQKWWPGETPFEVSVGAILTQNTSWTNVEKAILQLKQAKALDVEVMQQMEHEELSGLIRPAGYFNVKAKRIKNFVSYLWISYRGDFEQMKLKTCAELRRELLEVNGIGPETADSILLYALDKSSFVVDAYTKRIFERHKLHEPKKKFNREILSNYEELKSVFERHLPENLDLYQDFHAQIVLTAKQYCRSQAAFCETCPIDIFL